MNNSLKALTILTRHEEVAPFVDTVRQAADSARTLLGFFPSPVYNEYAIKGNLFVAVIEADGRLEYAGHLLFDLRPPKAKVLQVFVPEVHRRVRAAAKLISRLKSYLTELQFIAIYARVAEDMVEAHTFWDSQAFYAQQVVQGGVSRRRMIVVRCHELSTPQLFGASGIDGANPFGLSFAAANEKPTYLLDMNVLFDLGPRRQRREDVINVFRAERMQVCSLAISSEIQAELVRTCPAGKTDPMQDFAAILPTYRSPEGVVWEKLIVELGAIIFPERSHVGPLRPNDLSDLRHLGTVVCHGLRGLVTSDSFVLAAASALREKFGVEVLSPSAFTLAETPRRDMTAHTPDPDCLLSLEEPQSTDENEVRALLTSLNVGQTQQLGEWAAVDGNRRACHRYVVRHDAQIIGYVVWTRAVGQASIGALMALAEGATVAVDAARLMLSKLHEQVCDDNILLIRLNFPANQVVIREVAIALGFTGCQDVHTQLQKIAINGVVTESNWQQRREALVAACGVRLPVEPPVFRSVDQHIEIYAADGNRTHLPLLRLESALSPVLFCLPGRTGVMVPLRREFSEHLLQHLGQGSLLPQPRAQLYRQRHYLSHPKTLPIFTAGSILFFYESQKGAGLGAVVAVARVVRSYHQDRAAMKHADLDASVFEADQLGKIGKTENRTVTIFDNLIILPKPVFRITLKQLGCGTPVQLLSSRRVDSDQVRGILAKAYS